MPFWIYQRAEKDSSGVLGYEVGDEGEVYPNRPEDSKKYLRDLELYGGKVNVLMDQFRRWFIGLWQGKSLAFILAGLSVLLSFGFHYAARHRPSGLKSSGREENNRGGPNDENSE